MPALVAVKAGTFPVPLAANPMLVLLFAHVNVAPDTPLAMVVADADAVLQYVWLPIAVIVGVGFTVTI